MADPISIKDPDSRLKRFEGYKQACLVVCLFISSLTWDTQSVTIQVASVLAQGKLHILPQNEKLFAHNLKGTSVFFIRLFGFATFTATLKLVSRVGLP